MLAVLLKGEEYVARAIRAAWPDYEYRIELDQGTLDLMVLEGQWLKAKGLVKKASPRPRCTASGSRPRRCARSTRHG